MNTSRPFCAVGSSSNPRSADGDFDALLDDQKILSFFTEPLNPDDGNAQQHFILLSYLKNRLNSLFC
ncbi:MAG: hypothetical protein CMK59_13480 [Proteobacteria bacterium]|nr:hypothetical protein [Pseudomonadota bacterium]